MSTSLRSNLHSRAPGAEQMSSSLHSRAPEAETCCRVYVPECLNQALGRESKLDDVFSVSGTLERKLDDTFRPQAPWNVNSTTFLGLGRSGT